LEDALTVGGNLAGKRVLLIDDLYQSGATVNVAARTLKRRGGVSRFMPSP
jgi:predicted amidophosphoribosyltransferase